MGFRKMTAPNQPRGFEFRVKGVGLWLSIRVDSLWFMLYGIRFRIQGLVVGVQGLRFEGPGFRGFGF